jgi:hypothetical protein
VIITALFLKLSKTYIKRGSKDFIFLNLTKEQHRRSKKSLFTRSLLINACFHTFFGFKKQECFLGKKASFFQGVPFKYPSTPLS